MLGRYLLGINLLTFVIRGVDKFKAIAGRWRISEKQLLTLVAAGGILGALLGMKYFRHKTLKGSFQVKMYLIIAGWIILIALYTKDPSLVTGLLSQ